MNFDHMNIPKKKRLLAQVFDELEASVRTLSAADILQQAAATVEQRGKDYNAPGGERSMKATVDAFNIIRGTALSTADGWAFMVCLKMIRAKQSPQKTDSHLDGAAYLALLGEEDAKTHTPKI